MSTPSVEEIIANAIMGPSGLKTVDAMTCARRAIDALKKADYRSVPREPTEAMTAAADAVFDEQGRLLSWSDVWAAMLAAAPGAPATHTPEKTHEG